MIFQSPTPTILITGLLLLLFTPFTAAWLPEEQKELLSLSGTNLFNTTSSSSNSNPRSLASASGGKIRGVNLGSLFVFEPWMASSQWNSMGCGGLTSEFDCVMRLGQEGADAAFQRHWDTWITQGDIEQMRAYGLNTIRIPVGYWMMEEGIVYASERFPRGGARFLERVCGWASDAGFYIIIDMHGAPGAQIPRNAFTGQFAPTAGFYVDWQYARARKFLVWLTQMIHTKSAFRNVGMIGLVNEPLQDANVVQTMRSQFYPGAYADIRSTERSLNKSPNDFLHIQVMNSLWGAGNPNEFMTAQGQRDFLAYEDHRYPKWDSSVEASQQGYLRDSCHNNRGGESGPTIVTEFSISPADSVEHTPTFDPHSASGRDFYTRWFAAQTSSYERDTAGWVFWSWKTQLGDDYRWSYKQSVEAGIIPADITNINRAACDGY